MTREPLVGSCVGTEDPDLWHSLDVEDIALAKRICNGCPIKKPCLDGAKERGESWSVWGGELFGGMPTPIRQWAAANGFDLPRTGKIPREVHEGFEAHNRAKEAS